MKEEDGENAEPNSEVCFSEKKCPKESQKATTVTGKIVKFIVLDDQSLSVVKGQVLPLN